MRPTSRPASLALTRQGKLQLYSSAELLGLNPPQWLVHDILPAGGFVGMYGESYSGKSYVALDLALCIACGIPWHGRETQQGFVVYIAAEGGFGIRKRVQAWCRLNHQSIYEPHIGWLLQSMYIEPSSDEVDILCHRLENELEERPSLIVVDTLARCLQGDENLQEDMGQFVAGVDRLRTTFNAAVMAVHHTRVANDRERGSTAFRGAADTMILITKPEEDMVALKCTKQKDFDEFDPIVLAFQKVPGDIPVLNSAALTEPDSDEALAQVWALFDPGMVLTLKEVCQLNEAAGHKGSLSTIKRRLRELQQKGKITREYRNYSLPA